MAETKSTIPATNLNRELILGSVAWNSFQAFVASYLQALPAYSDDVERDFGMDVYERMMNDAAVGSSIGALKMQVLSQGVRFLCPVDKPSPAKPDPEKQKLYDRAEEVRAEVERMMNRLQQPIKDILEEMLDALPFGHALAEETYESRGGLLALTKLRVKPRGAYGLVVDQQMNLHGAIAAKPGESSVSVWQTQITPDQLVPRGKFWIFSYQTRAGDPRGRSALRIAYNPWYLKQQAWPMYLKHLAQFGTPSLWATLPPDAGGPMQVLNADGTVLIGADGLPVEISAEEAMLSKLIAFGNGTALVLPNGAQLNKLEIEGDGGAYIKAVDLFDRQITRGILIAIRAMMESEHGSRADSETAQDTVGQIGRWIGEKMEVSFYRDVLQPLVRMNWGDEAAEELCPVMALSDVAQEDRVAYANAIANLARAEYIHDSQKPGIDTQLGLPERDYEAEQAEKTERRLQEEEDRQEMRRLTNPIGGIQDDEQDMDEGQGGSRNGRRHSQEE